VTRRGPGAATKAPIRVRRRARRRFDWKKASSSVEWVSSLHTNARTGVLFMVVMAGVVLERAHWTLLALNCF
jgi:hypothetical protein